MRVCIDLPSFPSYSHLSQVSQKQTIALVDWWQNLKRGLEITLGVTEC